MEKVTKYFLNRKGMFFFILALSFFWFKSYAYLDPDFGYRLQNGMLILREGLEAIKNDPWSYTMQGYPFVEHSWGMAVFWATLFPLIGKLGLSLIYAGAPFLCLYLLSKASKVKSFNQFFPEDPNLAMFASPLLLLGLSVFLSFVGIRAQVITWLFYSVILLLLYKKDLWERYKVFVPLIFLLWTNLHAGFSVGLVSLFLVIFIDSLNPDLSYLSSFIKSRVSFKNSLKGLIKKSKFYSSDFLVLLFSFAATFINPYGAGVWRKVIEVAADNSLRWKIAEWNPTIFVAKPAMLLFIAVSVFMVIKYRKKIRLSLLSLYFLVFVLGMGSVRNFPIWLIVALPITSDTIYYLYDDIKKIKFGRGRFRKSFFIFWIATFVFFIFQLPFVVVNSAALSEDSFYPEDAVEYLKKEKVEGEVFSTYNWGGYLVWKYPEKRVFITGQMPSWRWEEPEEEKLASAFETYGDIITGDTDYKRTFDKYSVNYVLWPRKNRRTPLEHIQARVEEYLVRFGREKSEFDFMAQLEKDGWKRVYQDEVSVIYKNQPN